MNNDFMGVRIMGFYNTGNYEKIKITAVIMFFVFVLGIVTGTVFYMKSGEKKQIAMDAVISSSQMLIDNGNEWEISKNVFTDNVVYALIIFVSAFFKLGILSTFFSLIRKGFVTGFFTASAVSALGVKGVIIPTLTLIDTIPCILVFVLFSAISVLYSLEKLEKRKKILIFFLFFLISIFCVLALSRGFLTTTFMKIIYPKMI